MIFKKLKIFSFILFLVLVACGAFETDKQFTNKTLAPNFVAELYGSSTQTLTISHPDGAYVSWMGFVQSNDYKYFKITKVSVGSRSILADGQENQGEVFTATPNAIIEDINVPPSGEDSTDYSNGHISVAGDNDLKITIQYSPLTAIDNESTPQVANLIINYTKPELGFMLVTLNGYTQGVKAEKCTQAVSTMEAIAYKVKNSSFDLYFCSKEVGKVGQNNTPQDPSDPDFHGTSTNIASIPLDNDTFTFYKVDDETVCVLSQPDPSLYPFVLPIPPGLAPIDSMDLELVEGSFAECSLDADNNILCEENILIDALVSLTGFSLSNQGFTAEETAAADCPDFGAVNGAGAFGDDEFTIVVTGKTVEDFNTKEYNIIDSRIVGVIDLEK